MGLSSVPRKFGGRLRRFERLAGQWFRSLRSLHHTAFVLGSRRLEDTRARACATARPLSLPGC